MSQSVDQLLTALLGSPASPPVAPAPAAAGQAPSAATGAALHHYRKALEALGRGDWRQFGAEMDELRGALESGAAAP
jgi:hypothetical protein